MAARETRRSESSFLGRGGRGSVDVQWDGSIQAERDRSGVGEGAAALDISQNIGCCRIGCCEPLASSRCRRWVRWGMFSSGDRLLAFR